MTSDFSYSFYKNMLQAGLDTEYQYIFFNELEENTDNKNIILRHDIDLSALAALKLAEIESELGIKSTFFFRLNSTFYSPLSYRDYEAISKIVGLGHQLGLHFDPGFYQTNGIEMFDGIKRDKTILETAFNTEVIALSQHRPFSLGQAERNDENAELMKYFTYNEEFISTNAKYISDSGQRWREGDLTQHLGAGHQTIQVLVHPCWWQEQFTPWQECLKLIEAESTSTITNKIDILLDRYADYLSKREDNKKTA